MHSPPDQQSETLRTVARRVKFMVDTQLPGLLAIRLNELGHTARHTLDLAKGNQTADRDITNLADKESAVVITKDADFVDSHILSGKPAKLLLGSTGNITNSKLLGMFEIHLKASSPPWMLPTLLKSPLPVW